MIIIKLQGGLGNQLFQYALGRALSVKTGATLKFDITSYQTKTVNTPRTYRLEEFNVVGTIARNDEIAQFIRPAWRAWLDRKNPRTITEIAAEFDASVLGTKPPAYLDGYWQSEKYFRPIAAQLRKEITLRTPLSPYYAQIAQKIGGTEHPVAIHVRRGDYVANEETRRIHGVCGIDYYEKALKEIGEMRANPTFFIFSDDIHWVAANLSIPFSHILVDAPPKETNECMELMLMSNCHDHIIANSSFSWWGAWLSDTPTKIVIAPRQWVIKKSLNTTDRLPPEWLLI